MSHDFSDKLMKLTEEQVQVTSTPFPITQEDVRSVLKRNKVNKSPGPDGITGRIVKRLLLFRVGGALDSGQFAYRASRRLRMPRLHY